MKSLYRAANYVCAHSKVKKWSLSLYLLAGDVRTFILSSLCIFLKTEKLDSLLLIEIQEMRLKKGCKHSSVINTEVPNSFQQHPCYPSLGSCVGSYLWAKMGAREDRDRREKERERGEREGERLRTTERKREREIL